MSFGEMREGRRFPVEEGRRLPATPAWGAKAVTREGSSSQGRERSEAVAGAGGYRQGGEYRRHEAVVRHEGETQGYTIFVDGVDDTLSYGFRALFARYMMVQIAYLQRNKKHGRFFRFGFITFGSAQDVANAIKALDGLKLGSTCITVARAKYQAPRNQVHRTSQYREKEWRRKEPQGRLANPKRCRTSYVAEEGKGRDVEYLAVATLLGYQDVAVVQEFLNSNGLNMILIKPLCAKQVILEFKTREDMLRVLHDATDFLLQKFEMVELSLIGQYQNDFLSGSSCVKSH